MKQSIQYRMEELKKEFDKGQSKLQELQQQQAHLHETLLRIGGAIQVLTELMEQESAESGHKSISKKSEKDKSQ